MSTLSLPTFTLANASRVTSQLAVGGDLDYDNTLALAQISELADAGITHIVDVRIEHSDADFVATHAPQISYLHLGVDDAGQRIPVAWFDTAVRFVLAALAEPDAVVLTHCHMGINRGPSLGFAVLLAQGWDPVAALDAIRVARPIAYIAYAEQALDWHHEMSGATTAKRMDDRARVAAWRRENRLDVADAIRRMRLQLGR